jgi:hypothetical protein
MSAAVLDQCPDLKFSPRTNPWYVRRTSHKHYLAKKPSKTIDITMATCERSCTTIEHKPRQTSTTIRCVVIEQQFWHENALIA